MLRCGKKNLVTSRVAVERLGDVATDTRFLTGFTGLNRIQIRSSILFNPVNPVKNSYRIILAERVARPLFLRVDVSQGVHGGAVEFAFLVFVFDDFA